MSYVKHNYKRGDELLASQLNEMDEQIAANETIAQSLVEISNVAPSEDNNRIWMKETSTEIQIPTMNDIQILVSSPLTASTASDMTNTEKVYIYTGNETGYVNGNWYYYDDENDSWVSGGVYNALAVQTDDTLSREGMAADAAAVGALKNEIDAKPDIDLGITGATVGSYAVIKEIDENGKPTEWDFGEGPEETGGVSPYTSIPEANGVGSAGVSDDYARGDHVHPSDTTKADKTSYVTLSGTSITQVGVDNTMYFCGELTDLIFTAPPTGMTAIRFTSGSVPTSVTLNGIAMPDSWTGFLDANKVYEINVLYGEGLYSARSVISS